MEDDIEQQAEVVASGASPGAEIVEAAVNGEAGRRDEAGRKIADISGIGWITLASVVATQVALLWLFAWLAGPSIRESPCSCQRQDIYSYCIAYDRTEFRNGTLIYLFSAKPPLKDMVLIRRRYWAHHVITRGVAPITWHV